jgi:mono/diheme cytochrome c family protein
MHPRQIVPPLRTAVCGIRAVFSALAATAAVFLLVTGCGDHEEPQIVTAESTAETATATDDAAVTAARSDFSETAVAGEELFDANCALCHGAKAAGTTQGPTLIDRIYHPGHHSDFSFRRAVAQGVRQHHWTFGDMLPVATVTADGVEQIICYIRELQRANGIR